MKLAVLTHGFPINTNPIAGNFLEPFLDEIVGIGHKVWVITPIKGEDKPLAKTYPVETFLWGGTKLLGHLKLWNPLDSFALARFLDAERATLFKLNSRIGFDHILAAWVLPNAIAARSLKKRKGVPYSTWSLGTDINKFAANYLTRSILKILFKEASHIFANSRNLCAKITAISGQKAELLHTYRSLEKPAPEQMPHLKKDATHFLCVARLEPVKGPDILIEAFIKLTNNAHIESKDVHLHLLGDGSLRNRLEERVAESGISEKVHFYGMVDPIRVAGFLKVVDCLVLPSRDESMPVSFWEAHEAGVPVIGTDVGDLGWAIREYGQGIVIVSDDVQGLTLAMKQVLVKGKKILKPNFSAVPPDSKRAAKKFLEVIGA